MEDELFKAYAEIDYILTIIPQDYISKIPLKLKEKFNKEKDNSYTVNIEKNKKLKEQKLLKKTKTILAVLKYNYWCDSQEEKEKLYSKFKENEIKYQKEIREKYNPDNIFKKKDKEYIKEENTSIIEYKESFFSKFAKFIKKLFNYR